METVIRIIRAWRKRPGALDRKMAAFVPVVVLLLIGGCSSVSYYSQLVSGQLDLLRARQPVANVIADPLQDPALREHLRQSQAARAFASQHLHLPDNNSYRMFADIHRPYVVWNVFSTQEFSVDPQTHCFPIAGCVAYRGYYSQSAARGQAALQTQQGMDVYIGGVEAYSTLGWFDDPIISSMLHWGDERLATLIFHELAHQRFYVKDDSQFNESYASFVEQEGTRQWRAARGLAPADAGFTQQVDQFTQLVLATRARLQRLYRQPISADAMRAAKRAEFARMRADYRMVREQQWHGAGLFDTWMNGPMNNAKLLPFGLYDQWVPGFAALFRQAHGDWPKFFNEVERVGRLPVLSRHEAMDALTAAP